MPRHLRIVAAVLVVATAPLLAACGSSGTSHPARERNSSCDRSATGSPGSTAPAGADASGVSGVRGATPSSSAPLQTPSGTSTGSPPGTSPPPGGDAGSSATAPMPSLATPSTSSPVPRTGGCAGSGYQTGDATGNGG